MMQTTEVLQELNRKYQLENEQLKNENSKLWIQIRAYESDCYRRGEKPVQVKKIINLDIPELSTG